MSAAEQIAALHRAAERLYAERRYKDLAFTYAALVELARDADRVQERARRFQVIQGGQTP